MNVASTGPDKGEQVPYHPPIPDQNTFVHHVGVAQDGMISNHPLFPEAGIPTGLRAEDI